MKVAIHNFEFNSDSGNILFHFSRGLFKKNIMPVCFYQKQYLKEVFAKSEKGYRLKSKNILWWLLIILQLLLSVASIRRKLFLKKRLIRKKVESIQIQKVATYDSDRKKAIYKKIFQILQLIIIDNFSTHLYTVDIS